MTTADKAKGLNTVEIIAAPNGSDQTVAYLVNGFERTAKTGDKITVQPQQAANLREMGYIA